MAKKVLLLITAYGKNDTAGDRTFLPAGFPTPTSLASVTGASFLPNIIDFPGEACLKDGRLGRP